MSKNINDNSGEDMTVLVIGMFQCPFCQEMATYGKQENGDDIVIHTAHCAVFASLDLLEYLGAVRGELIRSRGLN